MTLLRNLETMVRNVRREGGTVITSADQARQIAGSLLAASFTPPVLLEETGDLTVLRDRTGVPLRVVVRDVDLSVTQVPVDRDLLKGIVDRMDMVPDTRRVGANPWVHVSSLVRDLCTRQFWLARAHDTPVVNRWRGAHRVAFAMGRAAETHVRGSLIDGMEPEQLFGCWKCRCGNVRRNMCILPSNLRCNVCGSQVDIYREPTLRNEEYRLVGRPDLTLHDAQRNKIVMECKSISTAGWNNLSSPHAEHLAQALMYRWMYEQAGYAVHDEVILFYVCKDFNWVGSPYREYHIDATSAACVLMVEAALATARECFADEVPPNRTCPRPDHHKARACPLATICFNL